jgi:Ser/Thr protein kinase RdoA (MazF antagonist)
MDHRIRIPKPLGFDEQYNLLIMEHAEGNILIEIPVSGHEDALFRAGQAINKLHQIKPDGLNIFSVEDEVNIINYWVPLTASVFPELSASLFKALDSTRAQLATMPSVELTLVHRDFYEKQILFTDNSTILIDFDTACLSDPAIDLGNFIAHLQLLGLQGISLPIDAVNCFVNGYGNEYTDEFHHRVMLYKRSTLLRLACLYSFWPQYNQLPKQLLQLFYDNE